MQLDLTVEALVKKHERTVRAYLKLIEKELAAIEKAQMNLRDSIEAVWAHVDDMRADILGED